MTRTKNLILRVLALAGLMAGLAGCASSPKQTSQTAPPAPYMQRAYPDPSTVEFQIAVRRFVPARGQGPDIWLAGASHVGEPGYYAALQRHLEAQGLVLFEGIKDLSSQAPAKAEEGTRSAPNSAGLSTPAQPKPDAASSLQVAMAKSLGLVFQLDAIDYDRPNFRNSDLSAEQIQALMVSSQPKPEKEGEEQPATEFQELVEMMQGTSWLGAFFNAIFDIIGSSPRLQALTKLAMIEMFGQCDGDLSRMQALPPEMKRLLEVLIQERNKAVIQDLKTELQAPSPPRSIAVLFGAAHLPDLEQRLRRELKYRPADQLWLPAFSVNTEKAGLTEFEVGLVRRLVHAQLQELQPSAPTR